MRVAILGRIEVHTANGPVSVGGSRLRALLVRLALDASNAVTVHALVDSVWPDGGPADPDRAIQALVSRLRAVLADPDLIEWSGGAYRLALPRQAVDALLFEDLVTAGKRAIEDRPDAAAIELRRALELWRGELLADVTDTPFSAAAAARLEELRLSALEGRIYADLLVGHPDVIVDLEALTSAYPLRERLRLLHFRALLADGRRAEALKAYERYRQFLLRELGTNPGAELQQAHLSALRGEKDLGLQHDRGNLKAPITSFIGRDSELRRVATLLDRGRLVTLVGPGGVGKTRLAATVAADVASRTSSPSWIVELARTSKPEDLATAMAHQLNIRDPAMAVLAPGQTDVVERLVGALSNSDSLIVMDGCEHLLEGMAQLVDELLGRCPRLRILCTSRERLGLLGEAVCTIAPLPVPAPGNEAEAMAASPAVRLFEDRAISVSDTFQLSGDTIEQVVAICRRLDGLPLAIELAAGRLHTMTLSQLDSGLSDRFRVLVHSDRASRSRHQTLREVVAWSWDLLDADEHDLLERLVLHPDSFGLPAARHLGATPERLDALVDKSLIQVVAHSDEPGSELTRFSILETVREYGRELLRASGTSREAKTRFVGYYLEFAERAAPRLRGREQVVWVRRLAAENSNLLDAITFAQELDEVESAVRLGSALSYFWSIQGEHTLAAKRLGAITAIRRDTRPELAAPAAAGHLLNSILSGSGSPARGIRDDYQRLAENPSVSGPMAAIIRASLDVLDEDQGKRHLPRDLEIPDGDLWERGMVHLLRSFSLGNSGEVAEALAELNEAAMAFGEAGERWGHSLTLTCLAFNQVMLGDFTGATASLESSLARIRELGSAEAQRVWLASIRIHTGDAPRARMELEEVIADTRSLGIEVTARAALADLARHDGTLDVAAHQLDAVQPHSLESIDSFAKAMYLAARGRLSTALGETVGAREDLHGALVLAEEISDRILIAEVAVGVAQLLDHRGAPHEATETLGAAHALRGASSGQHPEISRLSERLREAIGSAPYEVAYAAGQNMSRGEALSLIRQRASDPVR